MEQSAGGAATQQQAGGDWINLSRGPGSSWEPLDPVQVVAESRMMDKMSSQLVKESNLQVTITAAGRSFSDRLTHKCVKERYRRSFLLLPVAYTTHYLFLVCTIWLIVINKHVYYYFTAKLVMIHVNVNLEQYCVHMYIRVLFHSF